MPFDKIKLLIVGLKWPPETFIERLISGLVQKGLNITVVSKQKPRNTKNKISWVHPAFLKFYNMKKWDVIYFPWNSAAIENLSLFDKGIPCVVSCRGSQINVAPHNPNRAALVDGLRVTFEKSALVHCVSQNIKHEAMKYGLNEVKARIIYPAVDSDYFSKNKNDQYHDAKICKIITVGNLNWVKGYEYALSAMRSIKERNIKFSFEIIGEGTERQRVLHTIQDLELDNEVRLLGKLPFVQVCERLHQADIFILSSLSEGISNAVLEAMACGLPIVTTDAGGMREAVTDGVEGFVVPVRDSETMADVLAKLAGDSSLRCKMGEAGREKFFRDFQLNRQIESFSSMFRSITSKK